MPRGYVMCPREEEGTRTERRRFIVKTGGLVAAAGGAAVVDAPSVMAQPKFRWRLSTAWTPALDFHQGGAQRLATVVDEMSGGRFRIEVIVLGNSRRSTSDFVMAHAVMRDAIDTAAIRDALRRAGLRVECELDERDRARLVNVFVKCEPDPSGQTRGRRHVMFEDADIGYTRHIRGAVNAVVASVTGDPMSYVSAGAEHQGPPGGGVVAVLARVG